MSVGYLKKPEVDISSDQYVCPLVLRASDQDQEVDSLECLNKYPGAVFLQAQECSSEF